MTYFLAMRKSSKILGKEAEIPQVNDDWHWIARNFSLWLMHPLEMDLDTILCLSRFFFFRYKQSLYNEAV